MRIGATLLAIAAAATPALADVKAGVEAWNRKDYARAVREWRGPATAGDADAQYNIGQAYRRGLGVAQSDATAQEWYRKAADQGHAEAQASLALILFQSPRRTEAFPLLEKAAAQDEARAQYVLATALFNGDGIARDWPRAYALMRRSSLGGLAAAAQSLRQMEGYLTIEDRRKGDDILRALAAASTRTRPAAATTARASPAKPVATASAASTAPASSAPAAATETKAPVPTGPQWRVQLGAFGKIEAARAHWANLSKKPALGALKPDYVQRNGVVRLQAGPLANRAAAQRACAAAQSAGSGCFALQP